MTATNESNPWWPVFKQAITAVGGKLAKPEILPSTTDARYIRELGIPALGFSPMTNTPILLHEHNEVWHIFCWSAFIAILPFSFPKLLLQFLKDTVYLRGIEVYESVISTLSSFEEESHSAHFKLWGVKNNIHIQLWPNDNCTGKLGHFVSYKYSLIICMIDSHLVKYWVACKQHSSRNNC